MQKLPKRQLFYILIALGIADLLGAIDVTGVNIALPQITRHLNIPITVSQWIPNAYLLVLVASLIFMGKIGDIIGAKKLYVIGLIIFGLASLGLGFTNSVPLLIALRAIQGLGTAILFTMPMSIIAHLWEKREKAFAITASFFAAGMLIGPVIGGLLTSVNIGNYYGWHLLFLLNIPIIAIGIYVTLKLVPPISGKDKQYIDYLSLILLISGLSLIVLSFSNINRLFGVLGLALLISLYVYEKKNQDPMLDFTLFNNRTFLSANAVSFVSMIAVIGMSFVLTFYLQNTLNWNSTEAGLALLPVPIVTGIFSVIGSNIKSWKTGAIISSILTTAGLLVLVFVSPDIPYYFGILPAMILLGAGSGILMTLIFAAILGSAPINKSGSASGILNTLQQLGGLIGIAVVSSLVLNYKTSFFLLAVISLLGIFAAFFVKNQNRIYK